MTQGAQTSAPGQLKRGGMGWEVGGRFEGGGQMYIYLWLIYASLVAQTVKNPPAMWVTWVRSLGWEDPPGGGHGNPLHGLPGELILAWRIPTDRGAWWAQRVRHD